MRHLRVGTHKAQKGLCRLTITEMALRAHGMLPEGNCSSELFDELLGVFLCELEGVGVSGALTENDRRSPRRPPEA